CLLQDGDDLAVGESGSLHCRTFKKLIEKILLLMAIICRGDYRRALATEPLHDQYVVGAETGWIFPSECCWMKLPSSDRLIAMRRAEVGCSARWAGRKIQA
ncbi:hypothetical protein, partial [Burkholderia sp. LMU1-1-1.1]|uniref:hypothetical protein n=1 Tax=Burkholderia sp. LMU1-1-1.1 TaxID=3135266 RepID=UPI0034338E8B